MRKRANKSRPKITNLKRHRKDIKALEHEKEKIEGVKKRGGYYIDKLIEKEFKVKKEDLL